jgi:orotate phosphoribosyltransferase
MSPEQYKPAVEWSENRKELAHLLFDTRLKNSEIRRIMKFPGEKFAPINIYREAAPVDFATTEEEHALKIHEKYPSAPLAPVKIILRGDVPKSLINQIGLTLAEIPLHNRPDFCTAIPNAAIPLGKAYGSYTDISYIDLFEKKETFNERHIIIRNELIETTGKVLIIDDALAHAETKMEAVKVAEEQGFEVAGIMVVVDWEMNASQSFREQYNVYSCFTLKELLQFGVNSKKITPELYNYTISQLARLNNYINERGY